MTKKNINRSNMKVKLDVGGEICRNWETLWTSSPPTRGADPPPKLGSADIEIWLFRISWVI